MFVPNRKEVGNPKTRSNFYQYFNPFPWYDPNSTQKKAFLIYSTPFGVMGKRPPGYSNMKLTTAAKIFFLTILLVCLHLGATIAEVDSSGYTIQTTTAFSYHAGPGDSLEKTRALALYGAKHKAVILAAHHFAGRGLLEDFGDKQMEIFCLVADELQPSNIDQSFAEKTNTYTTKI